MSLPLPARLIFSAWFRRGVFASLVLAAAHSARAVDPGELLISEMNCAACHDAGPIAARLASRPSPRLDAAHSAKVTPQWMREFLLNPQATQPGTLMPDLLAGLDEPRRAEAAEALTHYLASLRGSEKAALVGHSEAAIKTGRTLYHTVGCVQCHAPEELPAGTAATAEAKEQLAQLAKTAVPLGNLAKKFTVPDLASFLQDPLKSRPGGRMPSLKLSADEARAIAMYLLRAQAATGQPMRPLDDLVFTVDPAKAAHGKALFASLNCAACHQIDAPGRKSKALAELKARQPGGCLATKPKEGVPFFTLTDRQRVVILAQLGNQAALAEPLTPEQQITRTLTTLNCYACHHRDRRGGADGLKREYFTSLGGVDLGDEGRIPPTLTQAGARLRPEWVKAVLMEGAAVRAHMATRMPLYGERNVGHLPELFQRADSKADAAK